MARLLTLKSLGFSESLGPEFESRLRRFLPTRPWPNLAFRICRSVTGTCASRGP